MHMQTYNLHTYMYITNVMCIPLNNIIHNLSVWGKHILPNIYTPSVFCYDKHKKNFDIQFSMKRHETV